MNDAGLLGAVVRAWIEVRMESIRQKRNLEARALGASKLDEFAKHKSEQTKYIIQKFCNATDTGLVHECMSSWMDLWAEAKAEAEVAEKLHKSKRNMDSFCKRNKAATGSIMNRASEHMTTMLLTRCMNAWRMDS